GSRSRTAAQPAACAQGLFHAIAGNEMADSQTVCLPAGARRARYPAVHARPEIHGSWSDRCRRHHSRYASPMAGTYLLEAPRGLLHRCGRPALPTAAPHTLASGLYWTPIAESLGPDG